MIKAEKTEKLNDLKNRISFTLKDVTLQQGFEIICKRIAELEKENKISEEIIIGEQQEINELKAKLCLMRKWIYGNFDLEDKIAQLKFIDEFGKELSK